MKLTRRQKVWLYVAMMAPLASMGVAFLIFMCYHVWPLIFVLAAIGLCFWGVTGLIELLDKN